MILCDNEELLAYNTETGILRVIDVDYPNLVTKGFELYKEMNIDPYEIPNYVEEKIKFDYRLKIEYKDYDISELVYRYTKAKKRFEERYKEKNHKKNERSLEEINETFIKNDIRRGEINARNFDRSCAFIDKIDIMNSPILEIIYRKALRYLYDVPVNKIYFLDTFVERSKRSTYLATDSSATSSIMFDYFRSTYDENYLTQEQKIRMLGIYSQTHNSIIFKYGTSTLDKKHIETETLKNLRNGDTPNPIYEYREIYSGTMTRALMRNLEKYLTQTSYKFNGNEVRESISKCNNENSFRELSENLYQIAKTKSLDYKYVPYTEETIKNKLLYFFNIEKFSIKPNNNYENFKELFEKYVEKDKSEDLSPIYLYKNYLKDVGEKFGVGNYAYDFLVNGEYNYKNKNKTKEITKNEIVIASGKSNFDSEVINNFVNYYKVEKYLKEKIPNLEKLNISEIFSECCEKVFDAEDKKRIKFLSTKEEVKLFNTKPNEELYKLI